MKNIKRFLHKKLLFYFRNLLIVIVVVPTLAIICLRWIDPVTSTVMLWHDIQSLFDDKKEWSEYQWLSWEDISIQFPLAVIAAEDQRFPDHFGLDFTELRRAISDNRGKPRGASTITQQVAKNLFLWNGRSYIRKGLEAGLAILMEMILGKKRILEIYINIAQLGENTYGVGVGSLLFFNKPAGKINRYEAARMAAVLPNPQIFSADKPGKYVLSRQKWIMKQMKQLGGPEYIERAIRTD